MKGSETRKTKRSNEIAILEKFKESIMREELDNKDVEESIM